MVKSVKDDTQDSILGESKKCHFLQEGQRRGCSSCGSVRKFLVLQVLSLGHCWEAVLEEIGAIVRVSVPGAFCTLMKTTSGIRHGGPCL